MSSNVKTGQIKQVIRYNGVTARVRLSNGVEMVIPATHRPRLGDQVVEGELSCECCKK